MAELKLTKAGYSKLEKELQKLETKDLPSIKKRMVTARSEGDLTENNAWISAKEEMEATQLRVAEIKKILREAIIYKVETKSKSKKIELGDIVTIQLGSKKLKVTIVSTFEADPSKQWISQESPIGKVLFDQEVGATVTLETPSGSQQVKILAKE